MTLADFLQILTPLVIALIGLGMGYLQRKGIVNADIAHKLELDIGGAVAAVNNEYINAIKAKTVDGVITDDNAAEARKLALAKLASIGKEKGIDYITKFGVPAIIGLIEKKVVEQK